MKALYDPRRPYKAFKGFIRLLAKALAKVKALAKALAKVLAVLGQGHGISKALMQL